MIQFTVDEQGRIHIQHTLSRPSVSLDIWFWRTISRDPDLRARFLDAASEVGAGIGCSFALFYELAALADEAQLGIILEVMDRLDYGFIDCDPNKVIAKETRLERPEGGSFNVMNPCMDPDWLIYVVPASASQRVLKVSDVIRDLSRSRQAHPEEFRRMGEDFADAVNPIIQQARANESAVQRARRRNRNRAPTRTRPPYTRDILRLAQDFIFLNRDMTMDSGEWMDLMHTIVPVAYLDFVLLDGRWCNFVRQNVTVQHPDIARVYKRAELSQFLSDLSAFTWS